MVLNNIDDNTKPQVNILETLDVDTHSAVNCDLVHLNQNILEYDFFINLSIYQLLSNNVQGLKS